VGLRDDQVNASKTTISQRREEPCLQRFRFTVAKIDTEYFPVPVSTNTESNHDCLGDDFPAHSGLAIRCREEHSTQQGIGEIRVAERFSAQVQVRANPRHFRFGEPLIRFEGFHQVTNLLR